MYIVYNIAIRWCNGNGITSDACLAISSTLLFKNATSADVSNKI